MNELTFLILPFFACLILAGIHTYLGLHVIKRGVIFVDISLAQIAALGTTVALFLEFHPEDIQSYFISLTFTFLGAISFVLFKHKKISQEALIGVGFALSQALSFLIADKIPHGFEEMNHLLNGNILWVNQSQLIKTAAIYSGMGLFYLWFHKSLWTSSADEGSCTENQSRKWDLVFYLSFGLIITSSVQIGGILLVFVYLIIPAMISQLFFDSFRSQLVFGWVLGVVASLVGIIISYSYDLPTGPSIVATFGLTLLMSLILTKIRK